ncbi:unnamed protein product [Nesidiocoris tenuis]|uniref:Uncharacterized protein n=1 Tax=Nesidiocoris tenuis TaxID=355587 RepID=A0A6H5GNA2_9HEMI|nr:unnamed protein product [Nesidiocoris tenuis]
MSLLRVWNRRKIQSHTSPHEIIRIIFQKKIRRKGCLCTACSWGEIAQRGVIRQDRIREGCDGGGRSDPQKSAVPPLGAARPLERPHKPYLTAPTARRRRDAIPPLCRANCSGSAPAPKGHRSLGVSEVARTF